MLFAVFDVDRTLIKEDSLLLAARFANNKFNFFKNILILPIYLYFQNWALSEPKTLKEKFLTIFNICELFNNPQKSQEKDLYKEKLIKSIRPEAIKRINYHKAKGHRIIFMFCLSKNSYRDFIPVFRN